MSLPWAVPSLPTPWSRVNHPTRDAGIPAAAAACSRGANAGSCRAAPRPATVARPARPPLDAGAAGWPLDATAPPATAGSAAATRPDALAAGPVSAPASLSPITPPPRASRHRPSSRPCLPPPSIRPRPPPAPAWASAQAKSPTRATAVLATGPAATSSSSPLHGPPTGDSARPLAVGRYDASASARPGSAAGDDGVSSRDAAPITARLDAARSCRHVLSEPGPDPIVPLPPKTEEGRAGRAIGPPSPRSASPANSEVPMDRHPPMRSIPRPWIDSAWPIAAIASPTPRPRPP